jgi:phosphodiesterase/alkaline phosphatase D-like protein
MATALAVLPICGSAHVTSPASPVVVRLVAGPLPQNLTDNSATIFYLCNAECTMTLKYGLSLGHLDQTGTETSQSAAGRREHRILLKNLQPDQNYFFEVIDARDAIRASGQFQTEPSEFAQVGKLRIIDGPVFEYLTSSAVQIAWTTNNPSSTLIRYGTDPNDLRKTAQAPWGQETHRVEITALAPNTKYYFVVESAQARDSGTMAKSSEGAFQTQREGEAALTDIEPRR